MKVVHSLPERSVSDTPDTATPSPKVERPAPRRRRNRRRWIGALVLVIAAAAAGYFAWNHYGAAEPVRYATAAVTRGDVQVTVLANGELRPDRLVAVGAQVSGRIEKLHVAVGDRVAMGDLIAEIDSKTQENAVLTSEASLAQVQAQLKEQEASVAYYESVVERQKATLSQSYSSQADYDTAAKNLAVAKAQVEALTAQISAAQVAVDNAKLNLGYTKITAPMDGTVLAVVTQEGQTVNAASSTPTIVVLGVVDTMQVETEISEADVPSVSPGMSAYFTILGNADRRFEATLISIDPAPESITSDPAITSSSSSSSSSSSTAIYYRGWLQVDNADQALRTYMTAEVHIILGEAKGVLTIPSAALGSRNADGGYEVRVLGRDGTVETRTITIGLDNKITVEVRDGLSEGERVITGQAAAAQTSSGGSSGRPPGPMGF